MNPSFLLRHGYALLFAFVLAEQIGLPIPAMPVLLAMGALAERFSLPVSLALATVASLVSDLVWYELGRRRGRSVLNLLCRISLEPDTCVRRTEKLFSSSGAGALLLAKFVPGLSTVAPPLAGVLRMRMRRFVLYAGLGAALWAGTFLGGGYLFRSELERVAAPFARLGGWLVVLLVAGLAAYIGFKYIQRQRFLRGLRVARITPTS
ncbi:MAG: DedA family protein [Acidobacteria bacterium]|nr:DedA family protein [Acidobacteriota bacterium]